MKLFSDMTQVQIFTGEILNSVSELRSENTGKSFGGYTTTNPYRSLQSAYAQQQTALEAVCSSLERDMAQILQIAQALEQVDTQQAASIGQLTWP